MSNEPKKKRRKTKTSAVLLCERIDSFSSTTALGLARQNGVLKSAPVSKSFVKRVQKAQREKKKQEKSNKKQKQEKKKQKTLIDLWK